MSEKDGFGSGFVIGTLVGGVIGGVIGAIAASRQQEGESHGMSDQQSQLNNDESMESARRSLEDKISQLNLAIDDVRDQLGGVTSKEKDE
jgi:Na+/glutamate symporter